MPNLSASLLFCGYNLMKYVFKKTERPLVRYLTAINRIKTVVMTQKVIGLALSLCFLLAGLTADAQGRGHKYGHHKHYKSHHYYPHHRYYHGDYYYGRRVYHHPHTVIVAPPRPPRPVIVAPPAPPLPPHPGHLPHPPLPPRPPLPPHP